MANARPLVGAIRWDAWHTPTPGADGGPVRAMERSLSPERYHFRAPFFATIQSQDSLRITGYTQAIVDREIAYAKSGELDYWAFLLYDPAISMSQGISLYLSSRRKLDMRFCAIAQPDTFGNAATFPRGIKRIADLMSERSYVRVLDNRPLLYLFNVTDADLTAWGGGKGARLLFDSLGQAITQRGMGNPYVVVMDFWPTHGKLVCDMIGADAISSYATSPAGMNGSPYSYLRLTAQNFWDSCRSTGAHAVPIAMTGWDRRPRIEHPVPWEPYQKPNAGMDQFCQTATPYQIADHVRDAMRWAVANRETCPAQAVIAYAWNEHDEGGWLCPTLNPDGSPNTDRLQALAAMLNSFK